MIFAHHGSDGFWVATSAEVDQYLGSPSGHLPSGFVAGRWSGAATQLGVFRTLEEAIAAEPAVPNLRCFEATRDLYRRMLALVRSGR